MISPVSLNCTVHGPELKAIVIVLVLGGLFSGPCPWLLHLSYCFYSLLQASFDICIHLHLPPVLIRWRPVIAADPFG